MSKTTPPRRGRPVDAAARAARRQLILDAARTCFAQKGFHAASTADISAAAGVSVANLYQYFETKDDLIVAMAEDDLAADLRIVQALREAPGFFAGLQQVAITIADQARDAGLMRLRMEITTEASRNPRVAAVLIRADEALTRALAPLVASAQARGEVRDDIAPVDAARLLLAISDGIYARIMTTQPSPTDILPLTVAIQTIFAPRHA